MIGEEEDQKTNNTLKPKEKDDKNEESEDIDDAIAKDIEHNEDESIKRRKSRYNVGKEPNVKDMLSKGKLRRQNSEVEQMNKIKSEKLEPITLAGLDKVKKETEAKDKKE